MLHKQLLTYVLAIFLLSGCSNQNETVKTENAKFVKMNTEQTPNAASGQIMQIIKLKSGLSEEDLLKKAKERESQFAAIPGIIQKYYIKLGAEGEFGGVYIWDSIESLKEFKESDLAKSIPQAYEVMEAPAVEIANVLFQLRD